MGYQQSINEILNYEKSNFWDAMCTDQTFFNYETKDDEVYDENCVVSKMKQAKMPTLTAKIVRKPLK